jgi:hypothetical protein
MGEIAMDRRTRRLIILLTIALCSTFALTAVAGCDSTREATAGPATPAAVVAAPNRIASDTAALAGHIERFEPVRERLPEDEPPFEQFAGHRP